MKTDRATVKKTRLNMAMDNKKKGPDKGRNKKLRRNVVYTMERKEREQLFCRVPTQIQGGGNIPAA